MEDIISIRDFTCSWFHIETSGNQIEALSQTLIFEKTPMGSDGRAGLEIDRIRRANDLTEDEREFFLQAFWTRYDHGSVSFETLLKEWNEEQFSKGEAKLPHREGLEKDFDRYVVY